MHMTGICGQTYKLTVKRLAAPIGQEKGTEPFLVK
ncbi:hypothetical protein SAMN05216516_11411 [Izhakiella capsodis]|uniref:Uncharacterized protein n=1 Tax=Izhakiella capsodis TaxID=1367852 RepID=A0A1I5B186_9GAMM|nr:hypothetical protein SAMN05216516_11411 [Izhakiella capsodis]